MLLLRIPLDFNLDASHKGSKFSILLLKKDFEFVLTKKDGTIVFSLSLMLLLVKIDFISEKQDCKRDVLKIYSIGYIEIVFALLTKVIALYIEAIII